MKKIAYPRKLILDSNLVARLEQYFNEDYMQTIGLESKFIQRSSSQLKALPFVMMQIFQKENGQERSLSEECDYLSEHFGLQLRKQSLDERYNTYAVKLMQRCLERILSEVVVSKDFDHLQQVFTAIRLTDSTSFQLPAHLACFYQSAGGGSTSEASIKIHQEYDLLSGKLIDIHLCSGKDNDRAYLNERGVSIGANELSIKDLGYHQLAHFAAIGQAGGFYLSRYKGKNDVYLRQGQEWNKVSLQQLLPKGDACVSYQILLTSEHRLPCRLIINPVNEEVKRQRIAHLKATARRTKWQYKQERELLCGYNIFITNTCQEQLAAPLANQLYRVRWQIELLFKAWKSIYQIHAVKKMNIFRFECYLLGRLIAICLAQNLQYIFKAYLYEKAGVQLSEWKSFRLLKRKLQSWQQAISKGSKGIKRFLYELFQSLVLYAQKEQKKVKNGYKPTPFDLISLLA